MYSIAQHSLHCIACIAISPQQALPSSSALNQSRRRGLSSQHSRQIHIACNKIWHRSQRPKPRCDYIALVALSSSDQHNHPIQNLYARATIAEHAKDLDTAYRLYVEAGSAFLNLSRTAANPRSQEQARQDADRALERAERIKAVKRDLAPVWRDPFALGSSFTSWFLIR